MTYQVNVNLSKKKKKIYYSGCELESLTNDTHLGNSFAFLN